MQTSTADRWQIDGKSWHSNEQRDLTTGRATQCSSCKLAPSRISLGALRTPFSMVLDIHVDVTTIRKYPKAFIRYQYIVVYI
jgi:hypothetical protein